MTELWRSCPPLEAGLRGVAGTVRARGWGALGFPPGPARRRRRAGGGGAGGGGAGINHRPAGGGRQALGCTRRPGLGVSVAAPGAPQEPKGDCGAGRVARPPGSREGWPRWDPAAANTEARPSGNTLKPGRTIPRFTGLESDYPNLCSREPWKSDLRLGCKGLEQ